MIATSDPLAGLEELGYEISRPHRKVSGFMRRAWHRAPDPPDRDMARRQALEKVAALFPRHELAWDRDVDDISADVFALVIEAAGLTRSETAVLMLDLADLSQAECANLLGVPLGTVKSALAQARKRLAALDPANNPQGPKR